jgi:F0F1-type ATP synthase assembly protein I
MTPNSSPPRRASRSPSRTRVHQATKLAQEFVAGGMAGAVVDVLEAVKIDEQDRQREFGGAFAAQRARTAPRMRGG